ncbi:10955_t:CDS:2 [Diversispora eburnea]|uniref:10955_t:CDS:1 n=1 Tax=Diversispora eburnea TaxID=1213867 RepID=A0A9N8ZLZ2_9GLOM|nr:10955_t:CDS:2 [Diversispora eburnea]
MSLTENVIDDIVESARYGELEELQSIINSNPITLLFAKDKYGNTPLHMASANGHVEKFKSLEQKDDVINTQNESGNTPLHWSALNGHEKVVKFLITNGADIKIKNQAGKTAIYEAQQNNHEKIVEFILSNDKSSENEKNID